MVRRSPRGSEQEIREYQSKTDKSERTAELQKMYWTRSPFNVRYELSNESSMTVGCAKIRWHKVLLGGRDLVAKRPVTPSADLAGNCMVNFFSRTWNDRRARMGRQKYTIYSVSAGGAIVIRATGCPGR